MLRVDRNEKKLTRLKQTTLPEAGWKERQDLQQLIRNSPDSFFEEMGEALLLLGEEVRPDTFVDDRIDLLALDQQGTSVIIELKRGSNKFQLLQALSYAAMVSKWKGERFLEESQEFYGASQEEMESRVEDFLLEDMDDINAAQRIILIAGDFDYEVLATAEWLTNTYEADIRCYRLTMSLEDDVEYLSCTCIFPPREITEHAIKRKGGGKAGSGKWKDWEHALSVVENDSVKSFFEKELQAGRNSNLRKREIHIRFNGKRYFGIAARKKKAYVWQHRRFEGDEDFWVEHLGEECDIAPVKRGTRLRFFLTTDEHFKHFEDSVANELPNAKWLGRNENPDDDLEEDYSDEEE